jgi:hypothetical protein
MAALQYKGTIAKIDPLKVTKTGFSKRVIHLKPKNGKAFPIQVHRSNFILLNDLKEGDKVIISAKPKKAGDTDLVNLVANGISK